MTFSLERIETPALVIDKAKTLRNIRRFQDFCDQRGLASRPHIKTHKSAVVAREQLAAGAVGITCQKIGEAEVMSEAGIRDILITFNILGQEKLQRLRALAARLDRLAVVADNGDVIQGLAQAFASADKPLSVLVECDTGAKRCGVQTPAEAVGLAQAIDTRKGLEFGGLMTYPALGGGADVLAFMRATLNALQSCGIACPVVSSGGTPDMWQAESAGIITEYRAGTYVYNDRSLAERGSCKWEDCSAYVLATVVSRPTRDRAILDAGSKALTSDLLGLERYGAILGHPGARMVGLSEEHGIVELEPGKTLCVGQRVKIIPNHVCVVSNLFDQAWLLDEHGELCTLPIDARGCVT